MFKCIIILLFSIKSELLIFFFIIIIINSILNMDDLVEDPPPYDVGNAEAEPNRPVPEVGNDAFNAGMAMIARELRLQNLLKRGPVYSGESPKDFYDWVKQVEFTAQSLQAGDDDALKISSAMHTLTGRAIEFLSRYCNAHPEATWVEVKDALAGQFTDQGDVSIAMRKLRRLTQRRDESVQNFSERLRQQASIAYPGVPVDNPVLSHTLIDVFIDGVLSPEVARHLIKEQPDGFEEAITLAIGAQRTNRAFEARRGETAMEVDMVTNQDLATLKTQVKSEIKNEMKGLLSEIKNMISASHMAPAPQPPAQWQSQAHPPIPPLVTGPYMQSTYAPPATPPAHPRPPRPSHGSQAPPQGGRRLANRKQNVQCFRCQKHGHYATECPN